MTKKEPAAVTGAKIARTGPIIAAIIALVGVLITVSLQYGTKRSLATEIEYLGRVIDINNQQPIPGAKITLDLEGVPPVVYADTEGVYQFQVVIHSKVSGQVRVDAKGYQVYTRYVTISPDVKTIEDIRLALLPIATFTRTATSSPPTFTSTATDTPTSTATATSTSTATAGPTTDPMISRGLDQNCLSPSIWKVSFYAGEKQLVDSHNCWDLTAWGIVPEERALKFEVEDTKLGVNITRRFRTKIEGDTEIKFTVRIDQFTTNLNFDGMLMMIQDQHTRLGKARTSS
jgi:hypothetical protein